MSFDHFEKGRVRAILKDQLLRYVSNIIAQIIWALAENWMHYRHIIGTTQYPSWLVAM